MSLEDLTQRWLAGWVRARGLSVDHSGPAPLVLVGDRHRETEIVAVVRDAEGTDALLRRVAGDPRAMLTLIGADDVSLRPGTRLANEDESLMWTRLSGWDPGEAAYGVERESGDERFLVRLVDGDRVAAEGQIGLNGTDAVFDRIETTPRYQRRGLGRWVMAVLTREALSRGCREGLLLASPQGRRLYEELGWSVRAPLVTVMGEKS